MESWKKAVLAGSGGLAALFLLRGKRAGFLIFGGVALATVASEYPETFAEIRRNLPYYLDRGENLLEVAMRLGERLADVAERRTNAWYEALIGG